MDANLHTWIQTGMVFAGIVFVAGATVSTTRQIAKLLERLTDKVEDHAERISSLESWRDYTGHPRRVP